LPLLQNGVILTDTSGLDDDPARTARTLQSLPDADAVIVVLSAVRFLTHIERQTLHRDLLPLGLKNLFFVVTMVDLLQAISAQPAQDLQRLRDRARETLGPLCVDEGRDIFEDRVFFVDSRSALGARASHKTGLPRKRVHSRVLRESGLPDFESALQTFLIRDRGRAQLAHLYSVQERARHALVKQAHIHQQTYQATVQQLKERHEELKPRLEALAAMSDRVGDTVDAFIERQQGRIWQDLRAHLARAESEVPEALDDLDLGPLASLDLWAPQGRERLEAALSTHLESWLSSRIESWQRDLQPRVIAALDQLRGELAIEAAQFDALAQDIVADFVGGAIEAPRPRAHTPQVDPLERWFSVAVGAVLLSPGTVAAAWTDGYEGALKGAASRIGVRLAVVSLGALLGPLGGSAIALYALSDAALLGWTGEGRIRRLRGDIAQGLRGQLVAQADASKEAIYDQVKDSLSPLRHAIVDAVRHEAAALQESLEQTVADRERVTDEALSRTRRIDSLLDRFPPRS